MSLAGRLASAGAAIAAAVTAGWLAAGAGGAVTFGAAAVAVLGAIFFGGVRPLVAVPVAAGTAAGGLIGYGTVRIFCLPDRCPTAELFGGGVTALLSFVGMTVVVVLAARSFDEHRTALAHGRPPPRPGCETGDCADPEPAPGD